MQRLAKQFMYDTVIKLMRLIPKKWQQFVRQRQQNNFRTSAVMLTYVHTSIPLYLLFIQPRWLLPQAEALSGAPPHLFQCSTASWSRVAPDKKSRASTLIRKGSVKKNKPRHESNSPAPLFLLPPQPIEGGVERWRRTYKCRMRHNLSRW